MANMPGAENGPGCTFTVFVDCDMFVLAVKSQDTVTPDASGVKLAGVVRENRAIARAAGGVQLSIWEV